MTICCAERCCATTSAVGRLVALRLGAKGFITKPFDRQTVLDAARDALDSTADHEPRSPATPPTRPPSPTQPGAGPILAPPRSTVAVSTHDLHDICHALAGELRDLLEDAIDSHRLTLDQILAPDYQRGSARPTRGQRFGVVTLGWDPARLHTA